MNVCWWLQTGIACFGGLEKRHTASREIRASNEGEQSESLCTRAVASTFGSFSPSLSHTSTFFIIPVSIGEDLMLVLFVSKHREQ